MSGNEKRAVIRANLFNVGFACILLVLSCFGFVSNLDSAVWIVMFLTLSLMILLFIIVSLRTKIYCGEKSFVYCGVLGKREEISYNVIKHICIYPLFLRIVLDGKEDIVLFSPAVSGIMVFANVAKVSDIRYEK